MHLKFEFWCQFSKEEGWNGQMSGINLTIFYWYAVFWLYTCKNQKQQNKSVKKEFNTLEFSLALILNVNMCKIINALNKKKTNINKQKHKNKRSHSLNKGGNFMHYKGACSTIDIL